MGQYYKIVNIDRKEVVYPTLQKHGLKIAEFDYFIVLGFLWLLSSGDHDAPPFDPDAPFANQTSRTVMGRWTGNRIVVIGDYDESGLYSMVDQPPYRDITDLACGQIHSADGYLLPPDLPLFVGEDPREEISSVVEQHSDVCWDYTDADVPPESIHNPRGDGFHPPPLV